MRRTFAVAVVLVWTVAAFAQLVEVRAQRVAAVAGGGAGAVNLPYSVNDNLGNQWMIYQQGMLRMQGNMPLYSQAAMLNINGNGLSSRVNQGRMDEKTGELIVDGMNAAGVNVTRRILVNRADSYVRYIDIFSNPTAQELSVNIQINSQFNYGVQSSQSIDDPKKKDKPIGWAASLHAGRSIFEVYAGKNAKVVPQINGQANNNNCSATLQTPIPANGQVAILHLHGTANSTDAAAQFVGNLRESQLIADLPVDIRKLIVNVAPSQSIGDREVLRGELFDVVELRGGDQLKGSITETTYKLQTFYGVIELPADRIVGLINVGQFKPRQLLVTVDGEVFGGALGKETIAVQLSSGQTTQVPLTQITRFGYRKRAAEPEEWAFDKPMIRLRSGERMMVAMPGKEIEVMTRYGLLKLKPDSIATIALQTEEHGVHEVSLTDGSQFAGLISVPDFQMQLVGTATQQTVTFPSAAVLNVQFAKAGEAPESNSAVLQLTNQDRLVGALEGQLKLDTLFDTIAINAAELRGMQHAPDAGLDVQVTLWDQTTLSGQLHEPEVTCSLKSGVSVKIPVALIDRYANPEPLPSPMMIDRIKAMVAELGADDFKQREQAEQQLIAMGPSVAAVLKQMSGAQSPEAQQRIESILKQVEKKATSSSGG
jgi:hypothetical protein